MGQCIDTPSSQQTSPPAQASRVARPADNDTWQRALAGWLIAGRFATLDNEGVLHLRLRKLEQAVTAAGAPGVPYATLRSVVRFESYPAHATARGLAAALHVPELAILLLSGQLDKAAVAPLLGHARPLIHSEQEYRAALDRLDHDAPSASFRDRYAALLRREWEYTVWLRTQLDALGFTEAEWQAMRDFLNSPTGRDHLEAALVGPQHSATPPADDDASASVPPEFAAAADDAEL